MIMELKHNNINKHRFLYIKSVVYCKETLNITNNIENIVTGIYDLDRSLLLYKYFLAFFLITSS